MDDSPRSLSAISKSLYTDGPMLKRKLQHWRPYICPFERLLPFVPDGARVLDVGCGSGLFLALLAGTGKRPDGVGFDVSGAVIDAANGMRERIEQSGKKGILKFHRLDVEEAWPEGPFDVVSVIDVMHHVPPAHQRGFFHTACKAVRTGGVLLYKDMCRRPMWRASMNRLHDLLMARQWIHYAPIDEVERWGAQEGMRLEHSEDMKRLWYGHEMRVFRKG